MNRFAIDLLRHEPNLYSNPPSHQQHPTSELLVSTEQSVILNPPRLPRLHRRQFIKTTAAAISATSAIGLLPGTSRRSEAAIPYVVQLLFGAAVGWFVERTLDDIVKPTVVSGRHFPTKRNRYHDAYSSDLLESRYRVNKKNVLSGKLQIRVEKHVYAAPSQKLCCYGLSGHDYSRAELITIHKEFEEKCHRGIPYPTTYRKKVTQSQVRKVERILTKSDIDPDKINVEYQRQFETLGYKKLDGIGLSLKGTQQKSLLFV